MPFRPSAALAMLALAGLSGCASFSRGITEAVLAREEARKDARKCYIRGRPFDGLVDAMKRQEGADRAAGGHPPILKVLMVHGIGSHQPGHSARLAENLARALSLGKVEERDKEFRLSSARGEGGDLGVLKVTRYLSASGRQEMIFYELTWDPIVEAEKQMIAFDNSGEYSFRRTGFNDAMKRFVNDTVPDVLLYNGAYRKPIQASVGQALCWMLSHTWEALPSGGAARCEARGPESLARAGDDVVFITHSLGSRITADALQMIAEQARQDPTLRQEVAALQDKRFTVFMLSNQLPLLQLGQRPPEVHGQAEAICVPGAPRAGERLFRETRFVAFSDPNDLFSYAIPPKYLESYVDSRLCPTLTNVILNVADVSAVLGLAEFANPMTAHVEYDNDPRVVGLLARGIGTGTTDELVKDRCEWLETVPSPP